MSSKEQKDNSKLSGSPSRKTMPFQASRGVMKPKPEAHQEKDSTVKALFEIKPTLFHPIFEKNTNLGGKPDRKPTLQEWSNDKTCFQT